MTKSPEPITTQFANKDRTVEVGSAAPAHDSKDDQKIKVRALRTFHQEANMQGDMVSPGTEFDCPRGRAAELRANGLIEYVDDKHDKEIHGEAGAKKIEERVKREQELGAIPEKHRTSPLRNPKLELAEVDPKDDPRADKDKSSKK